MKRSFSFFICVFIITVSTISIAQTFPSKPVTLVVPFPPGGPTDTSARLVAKYLSNYFKQSFVVENKAGAGGTTGSLFVSHALPDGYTLLWGSTSSLGVAPALYPKINYQPLSSFTPISMIGRSPVIFVANTKLNVSSLKEFIQLSKTKPLSYGTPGNGSLNHLVGEWLKNKAKFEMLHVPYKGGAQALNDLLGGQVDMTMETITSVLPFTKSDKLKILASAGSVRSIQLPSIPTVHEIIGIDYEAYSWVGMLAPVSTPVENIKVLSDALMNITTDLMFQKELIQIGIEPTPSDPQKFRIDIQNELNKWSKIIKDANIVGE
jgi:tripartite-type tricarboxylate transporter receptor subunit TctC